jgi:hypothetical protein
MISGSLKESIGRLSEHNPLATTCGHGERGIEEGKGGGEKVVGEKREGGDGDKRERKGQVAGSAWLSLAEVGQTDTLDSFSTSPLRANTPSSPLLPFLFSHFFSHFTPVLPPYILFSPLPSPYPCSQHDGESICPFSILKLLPVFPFSFFSSTFTFSSPSTYSSLMDYLFPRCRLLVLFLSLCDF